MAKFMVGCMQCTWNQFKKQDNQQWTEDRILGEIAQAGYEGAFAGLREDRSPKETIDYYARFGLKPAPGYLGVDFWKPDQRQEILEKAKRHVDYTRELGLTELFVATGGFEGYIGASGRSRRAASGHVTEADGMTEDEYKQFAEVLNETGRIMLDRGVRACFHNHVGTVIETRKELERVLSMTEPELIFLGPDTGHMAWAGDDVTAFCRDHAERIRTMHLKDIYPEVLKQAQQNEWDYRTTVDHGLFAELGEGFIDFPAIFDILRDANFEGWVLAETDVTQKPSALESVMISRNYLKSIGI